MINLGDDTFDVVNCPTDDLCIFIWISVFPNPIYNREGSLLPTAASFEDSPTLEYYRGGVHHSVKKYPAP